LNANPLTFPIVIVFVAILIVALCIRRWQTLPFSKHAKWRRVTERILLSLIALLCVLVAGNTVFNAAALRYYRAVYPAPGKMYVINGHQMHLNCTGEGSPTIVLEAGGGADSLAWSKVQPELSKTTRVCSYDRAGMGWSTPGPSPRDADAIVSELHALLQQASVDGPIVLMGHSMGGMYIRAYATRYPQEVTGLILVEGAAPLEEDRESAELRAHTAIPKYLYYSIVAISALGLERPAGYCTAEPGYEGPTAKMIAQLGCGKLFSEMWREYSSMQQSGEETINTGPYGDLPVLIFSRDPELDRRTSNLPPKLAIEDSVLWDQDQENLKRLSTRSRRIIAKGSGHQVPRDRADLINREVPIFIQQLRNNEMRTDYGSTTTE
jgi:pimeloyl-ACP methyl ester carboxylesterase